MTTDKEPGLPGPEVVGKFGDEVRNAIASGVKTATTDIRRNFAWWCTGTLVGTLVAAAAVCYWMVSQLLSTETSGSFWVHHANGMSEVCTRAADSTSARPVLTCLPSPP